MRLQSLSDPMSPPVFVFDRVFLILVIIVTKVVYRLIIIGNFLSHDHDITYISVFRYWTRVSHP